MVQFAALASGRSRINNEDKERFSKELVSFSKDSDDISTARSIWTIRDYVPRIDAAKNRAGGDIVFNISEANISLLEARKRLGSPQHYQYYFTFSKPSGSIDDAQLQEFLALAERDDSGAAEMFSQLAETRRPQGGTMAELLIDRLRNFPLNALPEAAVEGVVKVLGSVLDRAALAGGEGDWGRYSIWERSTPLLRILLKKFSAAQRAAIVSDLFGQGQAVGWLMNVIRHETFADGRYGDQKSDPSDWIITDEEYDSAVAYIPERIKGTDAHQHN